MSGLVGAGGAGLGAAVASLAFIVVSALIPEPAFSEYSWRYMFFTGLLGAVLSLFVLTKVEESPLWVAEQARAKALPKAAKTKRMRFRDLATGRYRNVLFINIAVAAGGGAQHYLTSGFPPTLLDSIVKMTAGTWGTVLLVSSLVVVVAAIAAGELSERIGRRKTMLIIGAVNLLALPAITLAMVRAQPTDTGSVLLLACLPALLANAAYAPVMVFLNERYPTALRARGSTTPKPPRPPRPPRPKRADPQRSSHAGSDRLMTPLLADRLIALNGVTGHVGATQPTSFTTTARKRLQPSILQPGLSAADRLSCCASTVRALRRFQRRDEGADPFGRKRTRRQRHDHLYRRRRRVGAVT